jgi:hypothetical protein
MIISRIDGGVLSIRGTTLAGISPAEIDVPQPLRLNGARRGERGLLHRHPRTPSRRLHATCARLTAAAVTVGDEAAPASDSATPRPPDQVRRP